MIFRKSYLLLFACLIFMGAAAVPVSKLDSLKLSLKKISNDSEKVKCLLDIVSIGNNMGNANAEVLGDAQEALQLSQKHGYYAWQVSSYYNIAIYFSTKGDNEKSLDNFLKALDVAEKQNLQYGRCNVYNRLSSFYRDNMKNNKKALEYSLKALEIAKHSGFKQYEATSLSNTGSIYYDLNDFKQSLKYSLAALNIIDSIKEYDQAATVINNIGGAYTELKDYDHAVEFYQKALTVYQDLHDKDGEATTLANIGNVYDIKGDMEQGVKYSLQSLTLARKVNDRDLVAAVYGFLSEGYGKMGDYQKAFEYQSDLSNLKDTLFNEANSKQVNDMQVKYDTEKKDRENKILELNVNRQRIINYAVSLGLLLVLALVFFVYRSYINKKRAHEELAEKNKIIEEKNKDILDSINYAKTIQHAILTPEEYLKETLGNYFIVYKPRDVVSGDFYWCHASEGKVIFAVADCTGHGVPGAFMSMIGNSLLNEVVIENKITDAARILNNLRTNLLKTLQQKGQNTITRDGMDIVLCVWDKNKNTLQYAGANNPMYLVRNNLENSIEANDQIKTYDNKLAEFLPDKQPIGYYENRTDNPFKSHNIQIQRGDVVYISSDGYADQFGDETGKKYTKKRFRETLVSLAGIELSEQKNKLDSIIESWKGNTLQTDDICLMGIKFS